MVRMHIAHAALVVALVLVPAAQAQQLDSRLELAYQKVTIQGAWDAVTDLQVVEFAPHDGLDLPIQYILRADSVVMRNSDDVVVTTEAGVSFTEPSTVRLASYAGATVNGSTRNREAYLAVSPIPGQPSPIVELQGYCGELNAVSPAEWAPLYFTAKREDDITFRMERTLQVPIEFGSCGQAWQMSIVGSFVMTNWEWDNYASGVNHDGDAVEGVEYASGYKWATDVGAAGTGSYIQNFFQVKNGRLDIYTEAHRWPKFAVAAPTLTGTNLEVRGDLLHATAIATEASTPVGDFVAGGRNTFATRWMSAAELALAVQGEAVPPLHKAEKAMPPSIDALPPAEELESQATMTVAPTGNSYALNWALAGAAVLLLAGVLLGWWYGLGSRKTAEEHATIAEGYATRRRALLAWRHAACALAKEPDRPDALHSKAMALEGLGFTNRAIKSLSLCVTLMREHGDDAEEIGKSAYELAVMAAGAGQAGKAAHFMSIAVNSHVGAMKYAVEAQQEPAFAGVADKLEFRSVFQGLADPDQLSAA